MNNYNNNAIESKEIEELYEPEDTFKNTLKQSVEGTDTIKDLFTEWKPSLQTALEKIAQGHNVTTETALSAFLGMCSVAIGGNKRIVSGKWEEKGLLWMAFHAPTGKGKTPLFMDCGREVMAKKTKNFITSIQYNKEMLKDGEKHLLIVVVRCLKLFPE